MVKLSGKFSVIDILCVLLLSVFACTLGMTFFHFVSYDEVAWFRISGRALYNGLKFQHFYYECKANIMWDVPWVFLPGRLLVSYLHPETFEGFRVMGITIYILLIGLISAVTKKIYPDIKWLHIIAAITALLSLGVLPYTMVWVRPESSIALGVAFFYTLYCLSLKLQGDCKQWLLVLMFLLTSSWFFSVHPKVVLLIPAIMLMGYFLFGTRNKKNLICVGVVLVMGIQSHAMWRNYVHCPSNKKIGSIHLNHALSLETIIKLPHQSLEAAKKNISNANLYIQGHLFNQSYPVTHNDKHRWRRAGKSYLPVNAFPTKLSKMMNTLIVGTIYSILLLTMMAISKISYDAVTKRVYPPRESQIALLILLGAVGFIAAKSALVQYEAPFLWGIMLLAMAIIILQAFRTFIRPGLGKAVLYFIIVVSISSQLFAAYNLMPYVESQYVAYYGSSIAKEPKPSDMWPDARTTQQELQDIKDVANACDLHKSAHDLLFVDGSTYLSYYDAPNVVTISKKVSLKTMLNKYNIINFHNVGFIGHCEALPKFIMNQSVMANKICCWSIRMPGHRVEK